MSITAANTTVFDAILGTLMRPIRLPQNLGNGIQRLLKQTRRLELKLEPKAQVGSGQEVAAPALSGEKTAVVRQFVADCFEVSPRDRVTCKALHEVHVRWCERQGVRPLSKTTLGGALGRLGFGPQRSGVVRARKGLRLKVDQIS